jgi:hypothetical protein
MVTMLLLRGLAVNPIDDNAINIDKPGSKWLHESVVGPNPQVLGSSISQLSVHIVS